MWTATLTCLVLLICSAHGEHGSVGSHDTDTVRTNFPSVSHEWHIFKTVHGKVFEDVETESKRFETFKSNLQYIADHNKLYVLGNKSFYLGINEFADMTPEEFRHHKLLGAPIQDKPRGASFHTSPYLKMPTVVDWRSKGYVTPVKNQRKCGSCWAFSATGALEGLHFKKTGKLISFSEQQLVDCGGKYGEWGCVLGFPTIAYNYTKKFGLEPEEVYKYKGKRQPCSYNRSQAVANCTGYKIVKSGNESDLQLAVATQGPVSLGIDAIHQSFRFYKGGVYNEPNCKPFLLVHFVLAVGYGTDKTAGDYWLVKNSWGTIWGDQGYIKMSRNKNNQCGVASYATFPV